MWDTDLKYKKKERTLPVNGGVLFCILGKFFPNIQKNAPLGIRHSDEMCSILELLDKEKSDKLCQIYATKKHPTARNL